MKQHDAQQRALLLEQSGELAPQKAKTLEKALSMDAELRALRDDLAIWRKAVGTLPAEPSPGSAHRIAARLEEETRAPALQIHPVWKPALALAAGLVLAAGLWIGRHPVGDPGPDLAATAQEGVDLWSDPMEEDLRHLETLILAVSRDALTLAEL